MISLDVSFSSNFNRFAKSIVILATLLLSSLVTGCGGTTADNGDADQQSGQTDVAAIDQTPEPAAVVSQFLDRVRRGGNDANASELLTKLAQQEMTRIGRPLQFPGSPDTTYRVGQSVSVPDQSDTFWVQTILSEPSGPAETGQTTFQYEVVWTLRSESDQWKISGFAIDQGDELPPMEIDFENGDEMEARLAALESENSASNR